MRDTRVILSLGRASTACFPAVSSLSLLAAACRALRFARCASEVMRGC